ncbi:peptide chain release factor 3 [Striga asiatica]|uniref:Peptide chain release factor 3 n=1 Tax=Striga asiatica TaxID=4170 RepID=A0A5A7Q4M8_STRAF|nr:peptide chain release factor 3 [Striga asiatica]
MCIKGRGNSRVFRASINLLLQGFYVERVVSIVKSKLQYPHHVVILRLLDLQSTKELHSDAGAKSYKSLVIHIPGCYHTQVRQCFPPFLFLGRFQSNVKTSRLNCRIRYNISIRSPSSASTSRTSSTIHLNLRQIDN